MMRAEASFVAYKSCFENNHLKYCRKFNKLKFSDNSIIVLLNFVYVLSTPKHKPPSVEKNIK